MTLRSWLRPPRQLVVVFLAVALVSAGALGWLGWLLLKQDAALDLQRRQDRFEQVADRAAASMQRAIVDLQASANAHPRNLPSHVSGISLSASGVRAWSSERLLYVPVREGSRQVRSDPFAEAERLEFAHEPLSAAAPHRALAG